MCGIAGFIHFDIEKKAEESVIRRMTDVLSHRGPDGEGIHVERNLALGHRRLSIIDVAGGAQPMASTDGKLEVAFNGEIYNYIEVRNDLRNLGHRFRTKSDTEVILEAYSRWGDNLHERLNGMWAFALWDRPNQTLMLSRDRLGEKPLYYALHKGTLVFGSELKSLLAYGIPREPDLKLAEIYLTLGYIPAPYSFVREVRKLEAGHYLLVRDARIQDRKYWDLPICDEREMANGRNTIYERFEALLDDSVRLRMRSDVAFGAFLSGGLDSASIVTLMAGLSPTAIETFTVGFREEQYDERKLARMVAEQVRSSHHEELVESASVDDGLREVLDACDEPFGDSAAFPTGMIAAYARRNVKMVLTGDGGDEVLSGYNAYQSEKAASLLGRVPTAVRAVARLVQAIANVSVGNRLNLGAARLGRVLDTSVMSFEDRIYAKAAFGPPEVVRRMVAPLGAEVASARDVIQDLMLRCPFRDNFYRLMYYNLKLTLPDQMLTKIDRMTMRHSLEARVPFLDYRLVEYMVGVSKTVKMRGLERKSVLRATIGSRLPKPLLQAHKRGFVVPLKLWFRDKAFVERFERFSRNDVGGVNMMAAYDVVIENARGNADYGNFIWMMMVYAGWFGARG